MRVIAFSGRKQSGKTTAVEDLVKQTSGIVVNFADYLKEIVCSCLGTTQDIVNGSDEDKNKILSCGKSVREALQIVGTDWFRSLDNQCWVRAYKSTLNSIEMEFDDIVEGSFEDGLILTADVRFPNEVKCVQDLGGHVIRLLRNPRDDKHESETALDFMESRVACPNGGAVCTLKVKGGVDSGLFFEAIIDNRLMSVKEQNEAVWKLLQERKWL